jgi:DHA1 family multidrug resistance protein-like MFS transporter
MPRVWVVEREFSNPFSDGIGPLLWSPLSEVPAFGRNVPYMISFFLFVILSIPTALVNNLGGFLVLRFLQGFFGSPCLANGGASLQDLVCLILNLNPFTNGH